jgi:SSS family solute:Na+ symporter
MAVSLGLKSSVFPVHFAGHVYPMYAAIPALVMNLLFSLVGTMLLKAAGAGAGEDATVAEDYA